MDRLSADCVGQNIREHRKKLGLTISDLAGESGLSSSWISNIETGKRIPSLPIFVKLCNGLDALSDTMLKKRRIPQRKH